MAKFSLYDPLPTSALSTDRYLTLRGNTIYRATPFIGPTSSTDNGLVRFDGTTGFIVQNTAGPTMADTGQVTFKTNNESNPVRLNNTFSNNLNAPVANEILFQPNEGTGTKTYGYGVISWYAEDDTRKDCIMQTHRSLYTNSTDLHRHWSLYTSNADRSLVIKRFNIPYMVDYAQWDVENSYIQISSPGDNVAFDVESSTGTSATSYGGKFALTNSTATAHTLLLSNSGSGSLISGIALSTSAAAIDISSKFGYKHLLNVSGGYGLNVATDGTSTISSSNGLARFAQLTTSDTANVINVDNRGTGKSIYVQNNGTEKFSVDANGKISSSADSLAIKTSKTPASSSASGITGDIAWDSSFFYICVATNTWHRAAHAVW